MRSASISSPLNVRLPVGGTVWRGYEAFSRQSLAEEDTLLGRLVEFTVSPYSWFSLLLYGLYVPFPPLWALAPYKQKLRQTLP